MQSRENKSCTALVPADAFRVVGISTAQAGLVIADRYGQIYCVQTVSQGQEFPGPAAIEQWVTFLATQCPECGVIDEPGYGEWAP